jgi:hypothetical protein
VTEVGSQHSNFDARGGRNGSRPSQAANTRPVTAGSRSAGRAARAWRKCLTAGSITAAPRSGRLDSRDNGMSPTPRCCQTTMTAASSMTESRPKPVRAMEEAMIPAVIAAAASTIIHATLAYSSQNPRRRNQPSPRPSLITKLQATRHGRVFAPTCLEPPPVAGRCPGETTAREASALRPASGSRTARRADHPHQHDRGSVRA